MVDWKNEIKEKAPLFKNDDPKQVLNAAGTRIVRMNQTSTFGGTVPGVPRWWAHFDRVSLSSHNEQVGLLDRTDFAEVTGEDLAEVFRTYFAISEGWNTGEYLVAGVLKTDMSALCGGAKHQPKKQENSDGPAYVGTGNQLYFPEIKVDDLENVIFVNIRKCSAEDVKKQFLDWAAPANQAHDAPVNAGQVKQRVKDIENSLSQRLNELIRRKKDDSANAGTAVRPKDAAVSPGKVKRAAGEIEKRLKDEGVAPIFRGPPPVVKLAGEEPDRGATAVANPPRPLPPVQHLPGVGIEPDVPDLDPASKPGIDDAS